MKTRQLPILMIILVVVMMGCSKTNYNPAANSANSAENVVTADKVSLEQFIKPENFVDGVTNQYFPLTPGDTLFYIVVSVDEGDTTVENIYVTTTNDIKIIQGIKCVVIHDVVTSNDTLTEDTYDWHAQDIYGNVWYFGEDTKALQEDGSWSTEGSFESGVDGALAGIIMPGKPEHFIGKPFRQEHYIGHAQDVATILSTNKTVTIGYGTFTNCVKTVETTALDPGVEENKWYAPGIGLIKASVTVGGDELEELVGKN